jgi:MFS superfamily sulfate permease-like transporter
MTSIAQLFRDGGILMWVAFNMVKPAEIKQVFAHNWFHVMLMLVTATMVIVTDFLTGVLSGMILYGMLFKFLDQPRLPQDGPSAEERSAAPEAANGQARPHEQPVSVS